MASVVNLAQELVDLIISYHACDTPTLLACSMTCRSWYIAAVPHLHHSLTTYNKAWYSQDEKYEWPKPLQKSYELGLLRFVKRLRIRQNGVEFTAGQIKHCSTLEHFTALKNLQMLEIEDLQVFSFVPNIQKYFGYFAPTLRYLSLLRPQGSWHHILYFIGLFPNLQDLILYDPYLKEEGESAADPALVPLSQPPLGGGLLLAYSEGEEAFVEGAIKFFNGLHFRYMHLYDVNCTRLLLEACAKTLETLRLYLPDPYATTDGDAFYSDFNLSKNTSLRTLETDARSIAAPGASEFFSAVLSTITSPFLLDLVVAHKESEVGCPIDNERRGPVTQDDVFTLPRVEFVQKHWERFKVLREMHSVRKFRLVLRADVHKWAEKDARETLERIVEEEGRDGGLDYLHHRPLVFSRVCGAVWAGVHPEPIKKGQGALPSPDTTQISHPIVVSSVVHVQHQYGGDSHRSPELLTLG